MNCLMKQSLLRAVVLTSPVQARALALRALPRSYKGPKASFIAIGTKQPTTSRTFSSLQPQAKQSPDKGDLQKPEWWDQAIKEINDYKNVLPPLAISVPSNFEYLNSLAQYHLTLNKPEYLFKLERLLFLRGYYGTEGFPLTNQLSIAPCVLYDESMNPSQDCSFIRNNGDYSIISHSFRTFTLNISNKPSESFEALQLGRLHSNGHLTYWVVVLDKDNNLWALRANMVSEAESGYNDDDMTEPGFEADRYFQEQKPLFGIQEPVVVKLCSLEAIQSATRKSEREVQGFSPQPRTDVESWSSTVVLLKTKRADSKSTTVAKQVGYDEQREEGVTLDTLSHQKYRGPD